MYFFKYIITRRIKKCFVRKPNKKLQCVVQLGLLKNKKTCKSTQKERTYTKLVTLDVHIPN